MPEPQFGDLIEVWPRGSLRVLLRPDMPGRFIAATGETVRFTPWIHDRIADGSLFVTNPTPNPVFVESAREPAPPPAPEPPPEEPPAEGPVFVESTREEPSPQGGE